MNMPNFTVKTRRIIILGVILLACLGALIGEGKTMLAMAIGGLLTLLKSDADSE